MEQKHFDKKNLLVIILVIAAIAAAAIVASMQKREINPTLGTLEADATAVVPAVEEPTAAPEATEVPAATEAPAEEVAAEATQEPETSAEMTAQPAQAYLVVSVAGMMYEPIPLYDEGRYTVTRGDLVNVIEVTPTSVRMYESSCDNQDCVEQGTVSLENYKKRVLQNMIICLPNEVVLELYTPEELTELLLSMLADSGEAVNE